ncbi:MAG TPA: MBL fold metallo-hydrolase [Vicinamibacterales bacterium]|nr:MBL fold metallo-hydrolase [Vicinamibacterales bacterium]
MHSSECGWQTGRHAALRVCLLHFAFCIALAAPAAAQISLVGDWVGRYHEDNQDRIPGPDLGDYTGLPVNDAARRYADSWDPSRVSLLEHQCEPYVSPHIYRGPLQFRISEEHNPDTQELIALKQYLGTYQQWRTIWLDGRPHPPDYAPHTWMGFSTGEWHGDILTVTTTHIKAEFFRRSGIPSSDETTLVEHYVRHGNVLSHVMIATDPVYLTEPLIMTEEFVLMDRGNQNWLYNCEYATEIDRPKNDVPHFLDGTNPSLKEYAERYGIPLEAARGGAETTYPEYMDTLRRMLAGGTPGPPRTPVAQTLSGPRGEPDPSTGPRSSRAESRGDKARPTGEVHTFHVQGNVYLLAGAGANIAVQVGDDGVVVVDTGNSQATDKVLAAIRQLSAGGGDATARAVNKEIRWIINTEFDRDHTGGNEAISKAGRTVNGNPAAVVAHENAAARMAQAGVADNARPFNTYFEEQRDFPFNGEPIFIYHDAAAHTDAGSMVFFRRSDVIVAGDAFDTTRYPVIDAKNGGSVAGVIRTLNRILELAVPSKYLQEGGTYIIPGHGRICDEADVVEYRDMVQIVSDRIADMVKKGMTLAQVQAAQPTLDYDGRYGDAAAFIEAIYGEKKR